MAISTALNQLHTAGSKLNSLVSALAGAGAEEHFPELAQQVVTLIKDYEDLESKPEAMPDLHGKLVMDKEAVTGLQRRAPHQHQHLDLVSMQDKIDSDEKQISHLSTLAAKNLNACNAPKAALDQCSFLPLSRQRLSHSSLFALKAV